MGISVNVLGTVSGSPLTGSTVDLEEQTHSESSERELVGTVLADEFEILEFIGAGGMSAVYKAHHRSMDRQVAVKILHNHLLGDERKLERFRTEAKTTSAFNHPNIVAVYSFLEGAGKPFLVMDFIEGESLQQRLKAVGKLDAASAVRIFLQACAALAHAHEQGVIHRDVKPSNIMLCKGKDGDIVKLLDFGIAKLLPRFQPEGQALTQTDALLGSPVYMSPEQCSHHAVDERSDIYSLGCVMYETLAGHAAVTGDSALAIMYGHLHEIPQALDSAVVPANLQSVIFKALQKEPVKRYQTMTELQSDLRAIDEDSKHVLPSQGRRSMRIYLRPLPIAAAAILPAVAMAVFITSHSQQFAEPMLEAQLYANSLFKGDKFERIKLLMDKGKRCAESEDFINAQKCFEEVERLAESAQSLTLDHADEILRLLEAGAAAKVQHALIAYKTASVTQPFALNKARNDYDVATDGYLNLARVAFDQNRFADVDRLLKEVARLDAHRPMNNIPYPHSSKVFILRSKMAMRQGRLGEGEQWGRQAVEYCQKKERGSLHHGEALVRLAGILLREKKNEEGERALKKAQVILASLTPAQYRLPNQKINPAIRAYKTTDPAFEHEMHNLSSSLLDAAVDMFAFGNYQNSFELALQAEKMFTAVDKPNIHLATMNVHLAMQYAYRHQFDKAQQYYLKTMRVCEQINTPAADQLGVQAKWGLADVLRQDNKAAEARKTLDEIIIVKEAELAGHKNETSASESIMACLMAKAATYGEPQSADREACFEQIAKHYRQEAPLSQTEAGLLAQAHYYLAEVRAAKDKKYAAAQSDLLKSEQFWQKSAMPNAAAGATYNLLARLEKERGDSAKAREYLHKALDVYRETVGTDDPSYKASKTALAELQGTTSNPSPRGEQK